MSASARAPAGLLCDLMEHPERTRTENARPWLGWVFRDGAPGVRQTAYRILVASSLASLASEEGDVWDSGKIDSARSLHVPYDGMPLLSGTDYYWQVKTWNSNDQPSPWSATQLFRTGKVRQTYVTPGYPLERITVAPQLIVQKGEGHYFLDFGRAAFGTLQLILTSPGQGQSVDVHLGEALEGTYTIQRSPPGCVRYRKIQLELNAGTHTYTVRVPTDARNTTGLAVRMPAEIGEVTPFRYCELVGCPLPVDAELVQQIAVRYPFNRAAADFSCSNDTLNEIWELCKYTIEATSFCGLYVDGDRERIPYEADAYINQMCHYCVDREYTLARCTHEYLIFNPTWPTEWILHSILIAWADYAYTGDDRSLVAHYDHLRAKTLTTLAREDGLISTRAGRLTPAIMDHVHYRREIREAFGKELGDVVDWPPGSFTEGGVGERDGYEMVDVNTVVNAFHYRALVLMGRIAANLDRRKDAQQYRQRARGVRRSFNRVFFDTGRGLYKGALPWWMGCPPGGTC